MPVNTDVLDVLALTSVYMYYQCLITLDLHQDISATLHLPRIPVSGDRIELGHVFEAGEEDIFTVIEVFLFPSNHPATQQGTTAWVLVNKQSCVKALKIDINSI